MPRKDKNGLTAKQEKYAQLRASGKTQRESYKEAYNPVTMTNKTMDEEACRLDNSRKVSARIAALKEMTANTAALNREDIAAALSDIAADSSKSDSIRLKALDQLSRVIGAYDDRQSLDIRAAVITGNDKAVALRAYLSDMINES